MFSSFFKIAVVQILFSKYVDLASNLAKRGDTNPFLFKIVKDVLSRLSIPY